jgi:hypothetical protein
MQINGEARRGPLHAVQGDWEREFSECPCAEGECRSVLAASSSRDKVAYRPANPRAATLHIAVRTADKAENRASLTWIGTDSRN